MATEAQRHGVLIFSATLWLGGALSASLLPPKAQQAVLQELSGEAAHDYVRMISRFERIQASEGWHNAALYLQGQLERFGYTDARIEGWPSNGSTWYYTWQTPIGWRAKHARLTMIEPHQKKLGDYLEMPNSLVKHSGPAGVTAELIDVGSGLEPKEYEGKDVRGKIVMAYGYSGNVAQEAIRKRGAMGMVNYIPPWNRKEHPDLLEYTAIWPKWEERNSLGFGFNVSKYDAEELLRLLRSGKKVVLRAKVESEFYESQIEVLTATIRGAVEPGREVLICAHLDHPQPSANDNASGSAGLLEMARTLKALIDRGEIPPPRRTVRFLWVSEFYGTVAYLKAHPERAGRTIAAINCDMIGEDQAKTGAYFYATRTPHSRPSFLNDLIEYFVKLADTLPMSELRGSSAPFHYRIVPYTGGSDHWFFNDASIGVPSTMLGHDPDPFHHTAQDTPDKVDPTELKRVSFIALGAAWFMANAVDRDAERLVLELYRGSVQRFSDDVTEAEIALQAATDPQAAYKHALNVANQAAAREQASIRSAGIFASSAATRAKIEEAVRRFVKLAQDHADHVRKAAPGPSEPTADERSTAEIVPVRADGFKAPLARDYLVQKLGREVVEARPILTGNAAWEAVNFVDGKRSLLEIHQALDAGFPGVSFEHLRNYLALLEKAQLLTLQKTGGK